MKGFLGIRWTVGRKLTLAFGLMVACPYDDAVRIFCQLLKQFVTVEVTHERT